jgi:hypothetical protein
MSIVYNCSVSYLLEGSSGDRGIVDFAWTLTANDRIISHAVRHNITAPSLVRSGDERDVGSSCDFRSIRFGQSIQPPFIGAFRAHAWNKGVHGTHTNFRGPCCA